MKSRGFILLMTLLFIAVISLLIATSMQHILLYSKIINKQESLHQNFYQLEGVTLHLGQSQLSLLEPRCKVYTDSANQIIQKLIHGEGCFLKKEEIHYRYFIEDLGVFPCLITYEKNQKKATHHLRVSVLQSEEGRLGDLLQIRIITPAPVSKCFSIESVVRVGVSSWRYMPSINSSELNDTLSRAQ